MINYNYDEWAKIQQFMSHFCKSIGFLFSAVHLFETQNNNTGVYAYGSGYDTGSQ